MTTAEVAAKFDLTDAVQRTAFVASLPRETKDRILSKIAAKIDGGSSHGGTEDAARAAFRAEGVRFS